jgi:hypothetical protein
MIKCLALLLCIRYILGSNLCAEMDGFCDLPHFVSHSSFISYPVQLMKLR